MSDLQRLLELLDGRTEITQFNIDLSLLGINFGNVLVVKDHLVKFNEGTLVIHFLDAFGARVQLLHNFLFFDLVEIKSADFLLLLALKIAIIDFVGHLVVVSNIHNAFVDSD